MIHFNVLYINASWNELCMYVCWHAEAAGISLFWTRLFQNDMVSQKRHFMCIVCLLTRCAGSQWTTDKEIYRVSLVCNMFYGSIVRFLFVCLLGILCYGAVCTKTWLSIWICYIAFLFAPQDAYWFQSCALIFEVTDVTKVKMVSEG